MSTNELKQRTPEQEWSAMCEEDRIARDEMYAAWMPVLRTQLGATAKSSTDTQEKLLVDKIAKLRAIEKRMDAFMEHHFPGSTGR